tara:strand:- start:502 stop:723 length:222 start_codon:yes stop_codon:yes gene_type:complete
MAPITGAAAYKKKDGTLTIAKDQKSIVWLPHAGSDKGLTIPVANITSTLFCRTQLQFTDDLQIFSKLPRLQQR